MSLFNGITKFFNKKEDNNILGVDIGSSSIKIVQLSRKKGVAVLDTFGEISLAVYAGKEMGQSVSLPSEKTAEALKDLMKECEIVPMVNQMEFHPYVVQQDLINFCVSKGILFEAWSPFMQGKVFNLDICADLSRKYNKSIAQIILRWNLQKGIVTIPKSANKQRIVANADIFDFELLTEDITFLDGLDRGERIGPDPDNFSF